VVWHDAPQFRRLRPGVISAQKSPIAPWLDFQVFATRLVYGGGRAREWNSAVCRKAQKPRHQAGENILQRIIRRHQQHMPGAHDLALGFLGRRVLAGQPVNDRLKLAHVGLATLVVCPLVKGMAGEASALLRS